MATKNKNLIYCLAGLLHDIGKFGQRADVSYNKSEELDEKSKKLAGMICNTTQDGYYTHQHVIWTDQFIKNHLNIFKNIDESGENSLLNLASYHHKPCTFEQAIITLADNWSSGIDRNTDIEFDNNYINTKEKFKNTPLVSIFNELKTFVNKNGIPEVNYAYELQEQNLSAKIFPKIATEINILNTFPDLWKKFNDEFANIKTTNERDLMYTIYGVLKKYIWYFPASTMDYPNSSLFEHSKLTGAFAHCLADYFNENQSAYKYTKGGRIELQDGKYPMLMVCGDISGIQNFIYNISNKSAMKGLKGRSFYVQLLCETLCDELLEACRFSIINQIYSAGGKFYLLLPNTESIKQILEEFKNKTQEKLWNEYQGVVSINMAWQEFTYEKANDISKTNEKVLKVKIPELEELIEVGQLWNALADKTSLSKKSKYNQLVLENFNNMFEPFGKGGKINVCSVTGEEIIADNTEYLEEDDIEQSNENENRIKVSKAVKSQIKIGGNLYNNKYLIKVKNQGGNTFTVSNSSFILAEKPKHENIISSNLLVYSENIEFLEGKANGEGFRLYGGLPMASFNGRSAFLEDLCILENEKIEIKKTKLGMLRMDVDNLGSLFQNGFEEPSFSKMSTLSSLLETFFSGYINIIKNQENFKSCINIVYSGGDDLFAVGRWDKLIEFAIQIRDSFKKFVCNRDDITLSAGIAIVPPKFPIAKAADMSGEAEKNAKNYEYKINNNIKSKDALNIFGISLNWQEELSAVVSLKNDLVKNLRSDIISKGLLMKFYSYYELYKLGEVKWRWQAAYTMARQEKDKNKSKEVFEMLKVLLFSNQYQGKYLSFDAIIVACRWAELEHKIN
jgi:CRISPR-associated protein Csm1